MISLVLPSVSDVRTSSSEVATHPVKPLNNLLQQQKEETSSAHRYAAAVGCKQGGQVLVRPRRRQAPDVQVV